MSGGARILIGLIVLAAIGVAVYVARLPQPKTLVTTQPATVPATVPATRPAEPPPIASYVDLIREHQPRFPATQPLAVPVSFDDAAHVVLPDPVYVCSRGDLWLTHPRAASLAGKLVGASKQQVHIAREKVLFVHWMLESGQWQPTVICKEDRPSTRGEYLLHFGSETKQITTDLLDLSQALALDDLLIAPSGYGVVMFRVRGHPGIHRVEVGLNPRLMYSRRGVIAWSESGLAMELVDGDWKKIGENLLQPLPLLDGSMLKIVKTGDETVDLQIESRVAPTVDEKVILELIEKLSDSSAQVRQKALNDLQRHGPGAWPVMEKNLEGQPPDARNSLRQLLRNRQSPSIAGLTLVEKTLKPMARLSDGGTIVFAEAGVYVSVPNQPQSKLVAPAWICMRPGAYVDLLTDSLVRDFVEAKTKLIVIGDEWIITDDVLGPRRFVGNASIPLVKDNERNFREPVAIDRRGRWVFRDPDTSQTLIIDPTLPDPTPKFPVWLFSVRNGSTGWDKDNWPCMKSGGTWALRESAWEALPKEQEMQTEHTEKASTDAPLLTDPDGNKYFGGESFLRVVRKDSTEFTWQLPSTAVGAGVPHLFRTPDGTLFLINQSSRVLRIVPTPEGKEPFEVQATFTRKIPDMSTSRRIWMDPAGRLIIAYEDNKLAICFPTGLVPQPIANMMPPDEE